MSVGKACNHCLKTVDNTCCPMRRFILLTNVLLLSALSAASQPVCHFTRYNEDAGVSHWRVTQMLQDKEGMVWLSTWNGLDRFDGYDFVNFKTRAGDGCSMQSDRFRDLRLADDGTLYCRAENDWFMFRPQEGSFSAVSKQQQEELGKDVKGRGSRGAFNRSVTHRDRYGTSWRVDSLGCLSYQQGGQWISYPLERPFEDVQFSMSDRQDNLWLLSRNEVYKLTFSVRPMTRLSQERPSQVKCLFLDSRQCYWVTTLEDATIRLYDRDNRLLGYLTPQGTLSPRYCSFGSPIYCITEMRDGTIWMGSKPDGLFRLKPRGDSFAISHFWGMLPCDHVYDIREDSRQRLWIATMGGGICCLTNVDSEHPTLTAIHMPPMKENKVRRIHITRDSLLLATTTEGLLVGRIPDGDVSAMTLRLHQKEADRANSLSSNATMDIVEDARHRFFVSTESGGVNEILTPQLTAEHLDFRHYNEATGLNSDIAQSMSVHQGQLWIVSSNQLLTLQPSEGSFGYYDSHFFHETCRFSEARPLLLPDGRWLFALMDGAMTMNAAVSRKSEYVPPIALTGIDKQGAATDYAVNHLQVLTLQPDERSLTVHFAALDYENPASVSYAFKMEGDTEWNYIGHNRSASFAGLEPGTYRLQLRSTNADGVWVENLRTLTIVVLPTFWEAWYGQLFLLLLFLSVIAAIVFTYLYIKRIKRQQHEALEKYLALLDQTPSSSQQPTPLSSEGLGDGSYPSRGEDGEIESGADAAFMSRVMAFVEAHIGDADVNIGDMADAAATSRSGLNRKMKSLVGLTPADFLREARIKRACQLLKATDDPVSDIAYRCGFTDPKYFSKSFKNSMGVSPTEYRTVNEG